MPAICPVDAAMATFWNFKAKGVWGTRVSSRHNHRSVQYADSIAQPKEAEMVLDAVWSRTQELAGDLMSAAGVGGSHMASQAPQKDIRIKVRVF